MPFKSKAQSRLFRAKEASGEMPAGTAHRWAHETPGGVKSLPEYASKKGAGPVCPGHPAHGSDHHASYDQGKANASRIAQHADHGDGKQPPFVKKRAGY